MSLQGKTALVTGSAGGLGRTIAEALLARGANVVICDINPTRLSATQSELEASHPNRTLTLQVNVAEEESVQNLIAKTVEKFGALDILVNNAGIMDKFDSAATLDKKLWDTVIAVNLTGPFLMTKHALPHMRSQAKTRGEGKTGGLIVNISSMAGEKGVLAGAAYVASKHGLLGLTKNTAGIHGPEGVYCVAFLLGGMETNIGEAMATGMNMEGFTRMQKMNPEMTTISTETVAKYVAFLSEDGIGKDANGSLIQVSNNWPIA